MALWPELRSGHREKGSTGWPGTPESKGNQLEISLRVNGDTVAHDVEPRTLLVHHLRDTLGLTGTNVGCDTSSCGACTVHVDGLSVKSCTVLAVQADGRSVTTIEGLATDGELHPMQEAFRQNHGLQCGFCTPGILLTTYDFLKEHHGASEPEIREALSGNLCRCTGYQDIVRSVQAADQSWER